MLATRAIVAAALVAAWSGPNALAQSSYTAGAIDEAPPEGLAGPILETLQKQGVRIAGEGGKPFADLWLREAVPAEGEPGGPEGAVLYPFLKLGQFVGVVKLEGSAADYRAQAIEPGLYTLRYGLLPVDGDHLGVSTYRDFLLLSLAEEDVELGPVSQEDLEFLSTGASGTTHPAVWLLAPAPSEPGELPSIAEDDAQGRRGLVLSLPVEAGGQSRPTTIQLIFIGSGPH